MGPFYGFCQFAKTENSFGTVTQRAELPGRLGNAKEFHRVAVAGVPRCNKTVTWFATGQTNNCQQLVFQLLRQSTKIDGSLVQQQQLKPKFASKCVNKIYGRTIRNILHTGQGRGRMATLGMLVI